MDRVYSPVFDLRSKPRAGSEPDGPKPSDDRSTTSREHASYYGSYEHHPHHHTLILVKPADRRTIFNVDQKEPLEQKLANLAAQLTPVQEMIKRLLDQGNGHAAH